MGKLKNLETLICELMEKYGDSSKVSAILGMDSGDILKIYRGI